MRVSAVGAKSLCVSIVVLTAAGCGSSSSGAGPDGAGDTGDGVDTAFVGDTRTGDDVGGDAGPFTDDAQLVATIDGWTIGDMYASSTTLYAMTAEHSPSTGAFTGKYRIWSIADVASRKADWPVASETYVDVNYSISSSSFDQLDGLAGATEAGVAFKHVGGPPVADIKWTDRVKTSDIIQNAYTPGLGLDSCFSSGGVVVDPFLPDTTSRGTVNPILMVPLPTSADVKSNLFLRYDASCYVAAVGSDGANVFAIASCGGDATLLTWLMSSVALPSKVIAAGSGDAYIGDERLMVRKDTFAMLVRRGTTPTIVMVPRGGGAPTEKSLTLPNGGTSIRHLVSDEQSAFGWAQIANSKGAVEQDYPARIDLDTGVVTALEPPRPTAGRYATQVMALHEGAIFWGIVKGSSVTALTTEIYARRAHP